MTALLLITLAYAAAMTFLFVVVLSGHRDLLDRHTAMIREEFAADYAREWDAHCAQALDMSRDIADLSADARATVYPEDIAWFPRQRGASE